MIDVVDNPGQERFSPARSIGAVMADYMSKHEDFYLFSPDETTSNKLDAVYEVNKRAWNLPREDYDLPESVDGRIVEMLSENALMACMTGHIIAGGTAAMTSYEAFFTIIASQLVQHLKFLKQSSAVKWRPDYAALNLLSTSTCWRQDHNGYTHQAPVLISMLLGIPSKHVNCLFPVDDVAAEAAFIYSQTTRNVVNLTTFNKVELPRYLDSHQADNQFSQGGASIFEFCSDENPDFVLTGVGDIVSGEAIKAIEILRKDLPEQKFRFVNIAALTYDAIGTTERQLSQSEFEQIFTKDKPIIANFHGYPAALERILWGYTDKNRVTVHGYSENGSTTTPFEMLSVNEASHYHLAMDVARQLHRDDLIEKYQTIITDNAKYAKIHGVDSAAVE